MFLRVCGTQGPAGRPASCNRSGALCPGWGQAGLEDTGHVEACKCTRARRRCTQDSQSPGRGALWSRRNASFLPNPHQPAPLCPPHTPHRLSLESLGSLRVLLSPALPRHTLVTHAPHLCPVHHFLGLGDLGDFTFVVLYTDEMLSGSAPSLIKSWPCVSPKAQHPHAKSSEVTFHLSPTWSQSPTAVPLDFHLTAGLSVHVLNYNQILCFYWATK